MKFILSKRFRSRIRNGFKRKYPRISMENSDFYSEQTNEMRQGNKKNRRYYSLPFNS